MAEDEEDNDMMIDYDYSDLSVKDSINELFAIINHKKFNADEKMQIHKLKEHII